MAERFLIRRRTLPPAGGSVTEDVSGQFDRISVYIIPKDDGDTADDSSVDVSYEIKNEFFKLKGAIGGVAVRNQIFPFTTEDIFEEVKIDITPGALQIDTEYIIEFWGYRQ